MDGLNYGTYYFFRSLAKENPELHGFLQGLTRGIDWLGSVGVLAAIGLLLVALLVWRGRTRAAAIVLVSAIVGLVAIELLNRAVGIDRPEDRDEAYAGVDLGPAFASRATFLSSLVYGLVPLVAAGFLPRSWQRMALFVLCLFLILAIGFSQLYLRVEYLTGVLAGWALGAFFVLLSWQVGHIGIGNSELGVRN